MKLIELLYENHTQRKFVWFIFHILLKTLEKEDRNFRTV